MAAATDEKRTANPRVRPFNMRVIVVPLRQYLERLSQISGFSLKVKEANRR